jgi:hypothetical protein
MVECSSRASIARFDAVLPPTLFGFIDAHPDLRNQERLSADHARPDRSRFLVNLDQKFISALVSTKTSENSPKSASCGPGPGIS